MKFQNLKSDKNSKTNLPQLTCIFKIKKSHTVYYKLFIYFKNNESIYIPIKKFSLFSLQRENASQVVSCLWNPVSISVFLHP